MGNKSLNFLKACTFYVRIFNPGRRHHGFFSRVLFGRDKTSAVGEQKKKADIKGEE